MCACIHFHICRVSGISGAWIQMHLHLPFSLLVFFDSCLFFWDRACYAVQAGLKFEPLASASQGLDYRCAPPHQAAKGSWVSLFASFFVFFSSQGVIYFTFDFEKHFCCFMWQVFEKKVSIAPHRPSYLLLASVVSDEKSDVNLIVVPLYVMSCIFLAADRIFSLSPGLHILDIHFIELFFCSLVFCHSFWYLHYEYIGAGNGVQFLRLSLFLFLSVLLDYLISVQVYWFVGRVSSGKAQNMIVTCVEFDLWIDLALQNIGQR